MARALDGRAPVFAGSTPVDSGCGRGSAAARPLASRLLLLGRCSTPPTMRLQAADNAERIRSKRGALGAHASTLEQRKWKQATCARCGRVFRFRAATASLQKQEHIDRLKQSEPAEPLCLA